MVCASGCVLPWASGAAATGTTFGGLIVTSGTKTLLVRLAALGMAVTVLAVTPAFADALLTTSRHAAPVNTEANDVADSDSPGCAPHATTHLPFSVSVDGQPAGQGGLGANADSQRCADLSLDRADVQIRYDGMNTEPRLDVVAAPDAALRGGHVVFSTYTNYSAHIARGEVLVFDQNDSVRQTPIATLPVAEGSARWEVSATRDSSVQYVLRVYDANGLFDETKPKVLQLADIRGGKAQKGELASAYGANSLEIHNISVSGGSVLVSGRRIAPGSTVRVMGQPVPVDSKGDFAYRQILNAGPQQVRVEIKDASGRVSQFTRSANIPTNDWFYVALADLTAGQGSGAGNRALVDPAKSGEFDGKTFVNGRLAFYLKGKVRGDMLLTASADTREQPIGNLFSNLDSKDPHYLLRNLDPNKYYPVYGDDSTITDDAPTRGKFYVRLERGNSHIMWGNFKTSINGTEFVRYDRGLYGARAHLESDGATSFGERRAQAEVFAAQPGTLGARDVFRGTGGSLYYLQRQNITSGSERVAVEVRDKDTGLVLQSKVLAPGKDYEMNALQGRVLLLNPLASVADDGFLVQSGSLGGNAQYLVVTYEYTPGLDKSEDKVAGGRGSVWLNDHVQVGLTGYDQTQPGQAQKLLGADLTLRYKPGTYVKIEGARSDGPGSGEAISIDGGFSFNTRAASGDPAWARRIEAAADLTELGADRDGRLAAYWQRKDAGFSGPGNLTLDRSGIEMGAQADVSVGGPWAIKAKLTRHEDEFATKTGGESDVTYKVDQNWSVGVGVHADTNAPVATTASPTLNQDGSRTDLAARLTYDSGRDWSTWLFGQGTVARTGTRDSNNRVGVGAKARITEKLTANGEVSGGDGGLGGKVGTEYAIDEGSTAYLSYVLDPDRTDILSRGGEGTLVSGARKRFTDSASVYGEERYRHGGGYAGLTHAFGLDFIPITDWKAGLNFETGTLTDPTAGDTKRTAVSGTIGFSREKLNFASKLEYRNDELTSTTASSERNTYLTANSLSAKVSDDWRFIGRFNGSWSDSSLGDFYDGNYVEAVTGFAYRPALDDRLNALFKFTFFYDLPSSGQIAGSGVMADYAQQSQVLSADADYDLTQWLTLGGKYAFRFGQLRDSRDASAPWFDSKAQLVIGRANFHLNKSWDVIGEARMLDSETADDKKVGGLIAVYRHINDNIMIGGGYNFTDFSDSLTDLSYNNRGVFANVVGKF